MLKLVNITNFLSIRNSAVKLSSTGLTALIGANGSGKSNFVKTLEFISELSRLGLARAIYSAGGMDIILPKAIGRSEMLKSKTCIEYVVELPKPPCYPSNALPPTVTHLVEIRWKRQKKFAISREQLLFNEPLNVAQSKKKYAQKEANGREDIVIEDSTEQSNQPSQVIIQRGKGGSSSAIAKPKYDTDNITAYISWFGYGFLEKSIKSIRTPLGLQRILGDLSAQYHCAPTQSMIERDVIYILRFCDQFKVFMGNSSGIKRYDFQLSELRKEQPISGFDELGCQGEFLPSGYQNLETEQSRSRVSETLQAIAPHILDTSVNILRSGHEYLEFIEKQVGRPVESWASSDGTLRALAILIALETSDPLDTLLIEEPEQCLHPWAIRYLMAHIRKVIADKNLQVILTTHSQQVLEELKPEEVLVVSRDIQQGTTFRYLNDISPNMHIEMGDIGRLWVKGLLGGIPNYE